MHGLIYCVLFGNILARAIAVGQGLCRKTTFSHEAKLQIREQSCVGIVDNKCLKRVQAAAFDVESLTSSSADCSQAADGPAVTSIVVAAGEVGSGTAGAAGGKHFSKLTPRGVPGHPEQHVRPRCGTASLSRKACPMVVTNLVYVLSR